MPKKFNILFLALIITGFSLESCHHVEENQQKDEKFQVTDELLKTALIPMSKVLIDFLTGGLMAYGDVVSATADATAFAPASAAAFALLPRPQPLLFLLLSSFPTPFLLLLPVPNWPMGDSSVVLGC